VRDALQIAWDLAPGAMLLDARGGDARCVGLDAQATVAVASDSEGIRPLGPEAARAAPSQRRRRACTRSRPPAADPNCRSGTSPTAACERRSESTAAWAAGARQAALRIMADGMIACSLGNRLHGWHIESGAALIALQEHYDGIESLTLTHDGRITGSHEGDVKFWRLDGAGSGEGRHAGYVHAIALGADERTVASGAEDGHDPRLGYRTRQAWRAGAPHRSRRPRRVRVAEEARLHLVRQDRAFLGAR